MLLRTHMPSSGRDSIPRFLSRPLSGALSDSFHPSITNRNQLPSLCVQQPIITPRIYSPTVHGAATSARTHMLMEWLRI